MAATIANSSATWLSRDIADYPEGIIIPVDKPYRWTSADVVRKLKFAAKKHFGQKNLKVGHAGTLDPLATGVLVICIGKATKLAEDIQRSDKEYVAGVTFGATTPSYDLEKDIDRFYPTDGVNRESIEKTLEGFIGETEQVAPLFSAKSVEGVRAYEIARKLYKSGSFDAIDGEAAALLTKQMIRITEAQLLSYEEGGRNSSEVQSAGDHSPASPSSRINVTDNSSLALPRATVRIACSKGTYIRALARDLGEALGSGAHLHSLRRTACGSFAAEEALSVEEALTLLAAGPPQSIEP